MRSRSHCNNIQEFHFESAGLISSSNAVRIEDLISSVIAWNVQILTLDFSIHWEKPVFRLPQSILTCKSLVKLDLGWFDVVVDIPESSVYFPSLKFLSVYFRHTPLDFPKKLISNCPVLEELVLKECYDSDHTFDINIPSLRKLKLDLLTEFDKFRRVIRAPNLEYLFVSEFITCILMEEYPFLNRLLVRGWPTSDDYDIECFKGIIKAISCTRCLLLSSHPMKVIVLSFKKFALFIFFSNIMLVVIVMQCAFSCLTDDSPLFCNLVRVWFEFGGSTPPSLAIKLLNNMPNVQELVLDSVSESIEYTFVDLDSS